MNKRDYKIAEEVKTRLSDVVDLVDIKVFGSQARGDEDAYSDMDIFIQVESIDIYLKGKIREIIWEVGFAHSIHISPLIFTRSELEDSPSRTSPIIICIHEEGVTV